MEYKETRSDEEKVIQEKNCGNSVRNSTVIWGHAARIGRVHGGGDLGTGI